MKKIIKTVIIVGYQCNNRCRFCIDSNKRKFAAKSTKQVISQMKDAKEAGSTYLELIGGEETIRPDFISLVRKAKQLGFAEIVMATNGRMLAYKDYAKKIVDAGITSVIFSIHGNNGRVHDYLTRVSGSFKQLLEGLGNLRRTGFDRIGSNTTIVKQNYRLLPQIGECILAQGIKISEFIFVDPTYGGAFNDFEALVPRISKVGPWMRKCLDLVRGKPDFCWHVRYVPLCYFDGYEDQISEIYERSAFHTRHFAPDFVNMDAELSRANISRVKTDRCSHCKKFTLCEGIWKEYYRRYGDNELIPFK